MFHAAPVIEIRNINTTVHMWVKILKLLRIGDFLLYLCFLVNSYWPEKVPSIGRVTIRFIYFYLDFSASFAFVCFLMWSLSTVFILVQVCHSAFMTARPAKMKAVLDPQRFYHFFRSLCFSKVMSKKPPAFRNESTACLPHERIAIFEGYHFSTESSLEIKNKVNIVSCDVHTLMYWMFISFLINTVSLISIYYRYALN